jgi:glyoxylase-like metal-dependent hydrolase (beta-lactamase superfamily II)
MVAAGVPGAAFSRDPSAVAFGRVERLTDRVWLVVERDDDAPVFLYVVVGASRVLLVDSGAGGEPYGDWLDGFLMGAAGLDAAARPRTCVNLDGNLRHVGGNGSLGAATTIAASGRDRAFTAAARDAARREARRRGRRDLEPYDVGAWLDDGASLDLGGGDAVRVVQTPGHAPDALCLWYARDAMLFAGDLVRPRAPVDLARDGGDLVQYLASLVKLNALLAGRAFVVACGRGSADLPGAALLDLQALVDDAITGAATPGPPPAGVEGHLFARGDLAFTTRRGRYEAPVPEARPPPTPR